MALTHVQAVSKYTERQWEDFKKRLAQVLVNNPLSIDVITENPDAMQYIQNYVQENLIDHKARYAIQGLTHKLANMEIDHGDKGIFVYPIVNEYKGHDLEKTMYFYQNPDGTFAVGTVPVITSNIVVP